MQRKEQSSMSIEDVFMKNLGYAWSQVDFTCLWPISGGTEGAR